MTVNFFGNVTLYCRIYVDAVINHMAQTGSGFGSSGSFWNGTASDFPVVPWVIEDFHGPEVCGTEDGNINVRIIFT